MVVRRHPLVLAVPFISGLLIVVCFSIAYYFLLRFDLIINEGIRVVAGLALYFAAFFTLLSSFIGWLIKYLDVLILTNKHLVVIKQGRLFKRRVSILDLGMIQDIAIKQDGAIQTLFRFGKIEVQTAGETPNFVYEGIADPGKVQDLVMDTKSEFLKEQKK